MSRPITARSISLAFEASLAPFECRDDAARLQAKTRGGTICGTTQDAPIYRSEIKGLKFGPGGGVSPESFGPMLGEWRREASPGKRERLRFLLKTLGLNAMPGDEVRYQLLHRAASAIIEGERYRAVAALLLVHSFSERRAGWSDYETFLRLFGVRASIAETQRLPSSSAIPLFSVWVPGDPSFLAS